MPDTTDLKRGRAAFANRQWGDAFAALNAADRKAPLAVPDLERLGRAAAMLGNDEVAFATLERGYQICLDEGNLLGACRAAFWYGFRLFSRREMAQSAAWLARGDALVEQYGEDCVERGFLAIPRIQRHLALGEVAAARDLAIATAEIGDRFGDADVSAFARQLHGRALLMDADIAGGLKLLDEAMLIAISGSGSELVKGLIYCSVIGCCQQIFAVDRAREWTAVLATWCDAQPQLGIFNGTCRVHRAELMQINGAWSDALDEARHAVKIGSAVFDRAAGYYQEGEIHRLRGEFVAADQAYERVSEYGGETQPGLALLRLAEGQTEAAAAAIRRVAATATDRLKRARFLPALVEIMVATGALEEAEAASRELGETASAYPTPVLQAIAAHAGGAVALAVGEPQRALPLLDEAFQTWQSLDAPYLAARVRVGIARAYGELGDDDGARLELGAARKVFERLHAKPDLARLDSLAPPAISSVLSRRELEVLHLVAAGKTNKSIANDLGLSDRTVDRHISNILTKLDVPSRAAATAYAYQRGLIAG